MAPGAWCGTDWADPLHDARGNTTTLPQPSDLTSTYSATYDAWNRLVEIKDGANVVARFEYDGLNRRVKSHLDTDETAGVDTYRHFYYNSGWQIVETRETATEAAHPESLDVEMQYVWSRRYIDAPVLRDRDADSDSETGDLGVTGSGLEERLYYTTDANMNVTALLDTDGDAVERYSCDPYGHCTVYDDDWSDEVSWANSRQNHIRYCGYYFDNETGLYHVRHRVYHATLGRWLQRDPIARLATTARPPQPDPKGLQASFISRVHEPHEEILPPAPDYSSEYADGMNLACYVKSNPLSYRDPSGTGAVAPVIGAVAAAAAACVYPIADKSIEKFPGAGDAFHHCWVSCMASKICGNQLAGLAGLGTEAYHSFERAMGKRGHGPWSDSLDDLLANQACVPIESVIAGSVGGWIGSIFRESCECCCRREVGYHTSKLFF
jgi:RHS repeat-associated protein